MKFKCECGSTHYTLIISQTTHFICHEPTSPEINLARKYYQAICDSCGASWGNYMTPLILQRIMEDAGVLK